MLLIFTLGLAAAGSSKTNPWVVAWYLLLLPALLLVAAILVYLRATSPLARGLALVLVAAPLTLLVSMRLRADAELRANTNAEGQLTFFRDGPMREIAEAIARNKAETVAAKLHLVDVNAAGMEGETLLIRALRQLRETPDRHEVLAALLDGGADPNKGTTLELPLALALQVAARSGPAPVKRMLDAGANPNLINSSGVPLFFGGAGHAVTTETLTLLLDHGADLTATDRQGRNVLFFAADARNWAAATLLLDRGVDWKRGRTLQGKTLLEMLEANATWASADSGFTEVLTFLRAHP